MAIAHHFLGERLPELPSRLRDMLLDVANRYAADLIKKPTLYPTMWVMEQQASESSRDARRGFVIRVTLSAQFDTDVDYAERLLSQKVHKEAWMITAAGDAGITDTEEKRPDIRVRQVQLCVWREDFKGWSVVHTEGVSAEMLAVPTTEEGDTWPSPE